MNTVRKCFKMKLFKGFENEYKKRHDELWSEMIDMIHEYGGSNYSIFLDEDIMISKHRRFIDIPKHKHNFIEFHLMS